MKQIFALLVVFGILLSGCPQEGTSGNGGGIVAPPQEFCTDSDGGKTIFTAGTVQTSSGTFSDRCLGNGESVMEYYCSGNQMASEDIPCPSGQKCYSGECREITCFDSDGGMVYGTVGTVNYDGVTYTDTCIDGSTLREFYCDNGLAEKNVACGAGQKCENGRCVGVPVCTDSDGGQNMYSTGTVSYDGQAYEDSCLSYNVVYEYYCEDGAMAVKQMICQEGEDCENGRCVEAPLRECRDTDGGKSTHEKGTITYWIGDERYTETDKCYDQDSVLELWCTEEGGKGLGIIECDSDEWCEDGECVSD